MFREANYLDQVQKEMEIDLSDSKVLLFPPHYSASSMLACSRRQHVPQNIINLYQASLANPKHSHSSHPHVAEG